MPDSDHDYSGMTVNERLFASGLIDDFDRAASARNREEMIAILKRVDVDNPEWTADSIIGSPAKYGY
jgi:hypothetical protein